MKKIIIINKIFFFKYLNIVFFSIWKVKVPSNSCRCGTSEFELYEIFCKAEVFFITNQKR